MATFAEQPRPLHIVGVAGGGGGPVMAAGLAEEFPDAQIDMVVPMHDYGGASQRIRDAYAGIYGGIGAPGDLTAVHCGASRQQDIRAIVGGERFGEEATVADVRAQARRLLGVMAVLRASDKTSPVIEQTRAVQVLARMGRVAHKIQALSGTLRGQTVRNMLLTALWLEHEGDMDGAVDEFGQWVDSSVRVIPASAGSPHLALRRNGQEVARGENMIDEMHVGDLCNIEVVVDHGQGTQRAKLTPRASNALATADVVIAGPGSVITSVGGALALEGVPEALAQQKAAGGQFVGVANLCCEEKDGGVELITLDDFAVFLGRVAGRDLDTLIHNEDYDGLPEDLTPLRFSEGSLTLQNVRVIGRNLVAAGLVPRQPNDIVRARTRVHTHMPEVAAAIRDEVLPGRRYSASQEAVA